MANKFEVEYAKSSRASCKQCKGKIDKDGIRFGYSQDVPAGDDGNKNYALMGIKWYHFECFCSFKKANWMKANLCELEHLKGLESLKPEDHQKVKDLWIGLKEGGGVGGTSGAGSMEMQGVLTDQQFVKFKEIKVDLSKKNLTQLKEMCAVNKLAKTGIKTELLDVIAENKILGVLPYCSACNKGKLKFSRGSGEITCSGYYDDVQNRFMRCKGPGAEVLKTVKRIPFRDGGSSVSLPVQAPEIVPRGSSGLHGGSASTSTRTSTSKSGDGGLAGGSLPSFVTNPALRASGSNGLAGGPLPSFVTNAAFRASGGESSMPDDFDEFAMPSPKRQRTG